MSIRKIMVVFHKEMIDLFRDKRTVVTSIVVPIILYPLLMIGFNSMMMRQTTKLHEQDVIIYIADNAQNEYSEHLINVFETKDNIQLYQQTPNYLQLFNEKVIQAIVTINYVTNEADYPYLDLVITYNQVDEKSELALQNVRNIIKVEERSLVGKRLQAINVSENILKVVELTTDNVASQEQTLGLVLAKILPYLLIMISIGGAAVAAVDLVAGEKERGTMETILVSAVKRNELVLGKFLAVISIAIITVLLNLLSIFFSFRHIISQAAADITMIQIPVGNLLLILVLMFPLIVFFSALLLSLSTYAKNMKEGYSYTQPIMILAMIMSLISALPAIETTFGLALIPVINVSLLIKDIMIGDFMPAFFFITLISNLVLVVIAIFVAIKLFSKESVLFRTQEDSSLITFKKGKWDVLSPGFAVIFFVTILMLFFYLGISWQSSDIESGLIKTLLILVMLPTLLVIRLGKLSFKKVLSLNKTKPGNYLAVIVAALPIFIFATLMIQVINLVYPIPEAYLQMMEELTLLDGKTIWFVLFLIALLPGITEELMFRGYFYQVFKKQGVWIGILVSSLLFAVLHLDIYRLIPVMAIGVWLGYLLYISKSIFVPMVAHILNNSISVLISRYGESIPGVDMIIENGYLKWWTFFPAIILFTVVVLIFNKYNQRSESLELTD